MSELESPKAFIQRCWDAMLRIVAIAIFGFLHWLMEMGIPYLLPENVKPMRLWLEDISFAVFSLVYVYLLWEILKLFIPWLNPRPVRTISEAEDEATS